MAGKFGRRFRPDEDPVRFRLDEDPVRFRLDEVPVEKEKVSGKERPDSGPGKDQAFCSDKRESSNLMNVFNDNCGHGENELEER